jgi:hypothetical protein
MAVPNTNYFTLQDVVNELGCAGNLTACFAAAVAGKFDSLYMGNKNRLMNFRNYGYVTYIMSVSPGTCVVSGLGTIVSGSKTQTVTSSATWTATKSGTFFTISPTSGSSGQTITIGGFVKNTGAQKQGSISITCGGGIYATVYVTQQIM